MQLEPRVCACDGCDVVFVPKRVTQKYCCKKCCDKQYRADHREEITQYSKQRHADHPEYFKQYRADHREEKKEYQKQWRANHPEYDKQYYKQWRANHPDARRAQEHRRRARKKGNGGNHTTTDLRDIHVALHDCCMYCDTALECGGSHLNGHPRQRHLEHIIGLAPPHNGSNSPFNLGDSCASCNSYKRTHDDCAEFLLRHLIQRGDISLDEAFHKLMMILCGREHEINQFVWVHFTKKQCLEEVEAIKNGATLPDSDSYGPFLSLEGFKALIAESM